MWMVPRRSLGQRYLTKVTNSELALRTKVAIEIMRDCVLRNGNTGKVNHRGSPSAEPLPSEIEDASEIPVGLNISETIGW